MSASCNLWSNSAASLASSASVMARARTGAGEAGRGCPRWPPGAGTGGGGRAPRAEHVRHTRGRRERVGPDGPGVLSQAAAGTSTWIDAIVVGILGAVER